LINHPTIFGLTPEEIAAAYARHDEPLGFEGKTREELLRDALFPRLDSGQVWIWGWTVELPYSLSSEEAWCPGSTDHPGLGSGR
jgi:hypothetical protein